MSNGDDYDLKRSIDPAEIDELKKVIKKKVNEEI